MDRMNQLVETLNKYAYAYYVLDNPVVADKEYDALYDELVLLEKSTGIVLPHSPTRKIGGEPIKQFVQHTHLNKLYSLDKCNSYDELRSWSAKIKAQFPTVRYTLEYKLDGLTICVTYKNGAYSVASTRGDGTTGEEVTEQVRTIKSLPLAIDYDGTVEVQGEGIMRISALEKYNKTAKEPLKNARNGVAGAIRNLDPKVTAERNLDVIFYNVNYLDGRENLTSQEQNIEFLKKNRLKTDMLFTSDDIEKIIEKIDSVDRSALDFVIDGMVVKVNDFEIREQLGYTEKFPKWAIAYKFEAEEATTILEAVEWNVGRTGKVTPLATVSPVELCGATIKRATLNNIDDIRRKKLKVGSRVFLRRSNDVIPEILGLAEDLGGTEIDPPVYCPSCGAELYRDGAHIFCPNEQSCPTQVMGRIEHFATKDCMDIRGVSEATIKQLYEVLGVRSLVDLYRLTKEDLEKLDGFKDKKITGFLQSVEGSKKVTLARFINALGMDNVGKVSAKELADSYGSMDALMNASEEELTGNNLIGEVTAHSIVTFFARNKQMILDLLAIGVSPVSEKKKTGGVFAGMKVVLTGTLTSYTRSQAAEIIEKEGGTVQSSVTKETDLVLAGENAGSKLDKANKLGKKIISENDFNSLINA